MEKHIDNLSNFPLTMVGRPWITIRETSTGAYVEHWHEIGHTTIGVISLISSYCWDGKKVIRSQFSTIIEKHVDELLTIEQAELRLQLEPLHPTSWIMGYRNHLKT